MLVIAVAEFVVFAAVVLEPYPHALLAAVPPVANPVPLVSDPTVVFAAAVLAVKGEVP